MAMLWNDLISIAPLTFLFVVTLIVLIIEAVTRKSENISFWVTVVGLIEVIFLCVSMSRNLSIIFSGMVSTGGIGWFFTTLFSAAALLTVVLSKPYLERHRIHHGEYYALILFAVIGMILMAIAGDLIVLFLGLELMSISLYVLAGFMRRRMKSNESALKYFLLGAFATGFLLYGIALIYGTAGTTNIPYVVENFQSVSSSILFWVGTGLLLVGFSFKVAAVPFHMWVPDVYEGAPTTSTAFMSTASKAAAFAAILVVFGKLEVHTIRLTTTLSLLAAASMILGNIVAISQSNLKRMLAYSSIAHAGYILTGVAAGNSLGFQGVMFYTAVYTMMNLGAFGVISLVEQEGEKNLTYDDYAGFSSQNPFLSMLMAMFMFSLAGIPPFGGFFAKYYVFAAAIEAELTWLAIVGVLTSLVSVYYYLRLVVVMYFGEKDGGETWKVSPIGLTAVVVAAVFVVWFGVFPSTVLFFTNNLF
jgi:NADH-quinone oxidoreductase subunit N